MFYAHLAKIDQFDPKKRDRLIGAAPRAYRRDFSILVDYLQTRRLEYLSIKSALLINYLNEVRSRKGLGALSFAKPLAMAMR
ncbi:MAG: hypothetical protein ACI8SR_002146 [Oceanicoccus sp.]|jgi:hypothetical protein